MLTEHFRDASATRLPKLLEQHQPKAGSRNFPHKAEGTFSNYRNWGKEKELGHNPSCRPYVDENWTAQRLNQQCTYTTALLFFSLEPIFRILHKTNKPNLQNWLKFPLFVGCNVLWNSRVVFKLHANRVLIVSTRYGTEQDIRNNVIVPRCRGRMCFAKAWKTFTGLRNV
jgi:hypothetical protein